MSYWSYWADKADEFIDNNQYYDAISCYEKLVEYNPSDTFALSMIGDCFSRLGEFDKALMYVNKAIDINPSNNFLWYTKGMVYFDYKMYSDAIKYFDKAISFKQEDNTSWYFKGWCYFYLGNINKAIDSFETSNNIEFDEKILDILYNLKQSNPESKTCPNCGRELNGLAVNCGFCGHRFGSGTGVNSGYSSSSGKKQCPNCGRSVNSSAFNCGFCGHRFSSGDSVKSSPISNSNSKTEIESNNTSSDMKRCPNCGVMLRKNKKICPKCNYNFKKSKVDKPRVNKHLRPKHFDNGVVSFDYPDFYSRDFNSKYDEIGILVSFKISSNYSFDSAFAIFDGEPISNKISDSKFKEVIEKSQDCEVLDINRYFSEEKERIIIKTQNNTNDNIEYRCIVPEIGFSILFVIPDEKEHLFDEKCISTVVDSLDKSTGESIIDEEPISTGVKSSEKSVKKSIPKKEVKVCTNCGTENTDDSNFCIECGMKLDISNDVNFCIHCGTEVVPGAKFCINCGKIIEY